MKFLAASIMLRSNLVDVKGLALARVLVCALLRRAGEMALPLTQRRFGAATADDAIAWLSEYPTRQNASQALDPRPVELAMETVPQAIRVCSVASRGEREARPALWNRIGCADVSTRLQIHRIA